jgi:uncharacterized protein (TIGR00255 family)
MTGFGRGCLVFQTHDITVDIRSVNHRFFEASVKSPRSVSCFEDKIKSIVKEKVTRGKIEISVSLQNISGSDLTVSVNENVLECYVNALRSVGKKMKVKDDLKLSALMRINEAFTLKKVDEDEEKLQEVVEKDFYPYTD